jgi:hypothetical protein
MHLEAPKYLISSEELVRPLDTDPLRILHTSTQQLWISFQYIFLHVFYASKISFMRQLNLHTILISNHRSLVYPSE